ncbi:MAG TPA: hypothetical protein VLE89_08885 [Chlamydiales bacterium]|nr:hypothetical protein [Chlamydiales bacterium]
MVPVQNGQRGEGAAAPVAPPPPGGFLNMIGRCCKITCRALSSRKTISHALSGIGGVTTGIVCVSLSTTFKSSAASYAIIPVGSALWFAFATWRYWEGKMIYCGRNICHIRKFLTTVSTLGYAGGMIGVGIGIGTKYADELGCPRS